VGTANDSVHQDNPMNIVLSQKIYNLRFDIRIETDISIGAKPLFHESDIFIFFGQQDADHRFRGNLVIFAVKGDSSQREARFTMR
jgi:hypothetical protein